MKKVKIEPGLYFICDDIDYLFFKHCKWKIARGYAKTKGISAHTFLMKPKKGFVVDHINSNKLDNRRENLRYVTKSINRINTIHKNKVLNGVFKRWQVKSQSYVYFTPISVNGVKKTYWGFKTPEEAQAFRQKKIEELTGVKIF